VTHTLLLSSIGLFLFQEICFLTLLNAKTKEENAVFCYLTPYYFSIAIIFASSSKLLYI